MHKNKIEILSRFYCDFHDCVLPFKAIANRTCIEVHIVKQHVRQLAKLGYLEVSTGFNEDGMIAGGGYRLTSLGRMWGKEQGLEAGGFW